MKNETSKLLREAIADAKAVRETALQNAKVALQEAFTPKLQSMLSRKLQQEMDDCDREEGMEELEEFNSLADSGLPTQHGEVAAHEDVPMTMMETEVPVQSNNTDTSPHAGAGSQIAASDQDTNATPDNDTATLQQQDSKLTPSDTDKSDMSGAASMIKASDQDVNATPDNDTSTELHLEGVDEEDCDEDDVELNEIIAELEMDLGDEEEELPMDDMSMDVPMEEPSMDELPVEPEVGCDCPAEELPLDGEEPIGDIPVDVADEEEIDIEEVLREMEYGPAEGGADAQYSIDEEAQAEIQELKEELAEYKKGFNFLRGKINEVNMLNAKLLYTNKVFKKYGLNNNQKMKIVEAFDRTSTVREVKLTYSNLCESFNIVNNGKKQTSITEGMASKAVTSTAPSAKKVEEQKSILSEGSNMAERFKTLVNHK